MNVTQWIAHLRAVATPSADPAAPLPLGPMEPAFRAAVIGGAVTGPDGPPGRPDTAEILLWRALTDRTVDVEPVLGEARVGPLLEQGLFRTIEVWTESELCAVHALHRLARDRRRDDWRARVAAVRAWHLVHTQPDNATNRPWALHVFLFAGTPESVHYAETLLHNAMASGGVPDPLSAWILLDAASELERGL